MKAQWLLVLHRLLRCWPLPLAEGLNRGAQRWPLLEKTWVLEAMLMCTLAVKPASCTGEWLILPMPPHNIKDVALSNLYETQWKILICEVLMKLTAAGIILFICRYQFKVQDASQGRSQGVEAIKLLPRALANYSVPSLMCLQRQRRDGIFYNESSPLIVTHAANNCSCCKWPVSVKVMNKSLSWYSHQEDHVGDRVLLSAICDQSWAGAGQFECGPGQSSRESVLRLHRRSHRAAHWTPVEHYQVAIQRCLSRYCPCVCMDTEWAWFVPCIFLSGVCSPSQCSRGLCCDLANLTQSKDVQSSRPVSQSNLWVYPACRLQMAASVKADKWLLHANCRHTVLTCL